MENSVLQNKAVIIGVVVAVKVPDEWLEEVSCNFCGSNDFKLYKRIEEFKVVKCKICGLIYTNPRVKEPFVNKLYDLPYYDNYSDASWTDDYINSFFMELSRLEKFAPGRRLLEIGCGGGKFLKCAMEKKWEVKGQEISKLCVDYINKEYGIEVFMGDIQQLDMPESNFDVLAMFHVLEHVYKIAPFLATCHKILSSNGIIVVGVPNISSPDLLLNSNSLKRNLHLPYHNYHFSEKTLTAYLKKADFEIIFVEKGTSQYFSHIYKLLRNLIKKKKVYIRGNGQKDEFSVCDRPQNKSVKNILKNIVSSCFHSDYLLVYARKMSG